MKTVKLNEPIIDFECLNQHEETISLSDLKKHRYGIIYFYPKDNTAG